MNIDIKNGDCLELLKTIPDNSIDLVLTDPPYGTTACKWDIVIPFDLMWNELNRICKDTTPICLFGSEPFSSALRMSNIKNYRYDWIWNKNKGSGFYLSKKMPLKSHEIISVFYKKLPTYNPQMTKGKPYKCKQGRVGDYLGHGNENKIITVNKGERYPVSVQNFNIETGKHPTQKPVDLLEYLIKTYSNENETVLDFTMGSGSTGVACVKTNRNFIGFELDSKYYEIAKQRIDEQLTSVKTDDTIQEDNLSDW